MKMNLQMKEELQTTNDQMAKLLVQTQIDNKKNEQRLQDLEATFENAKKMENLERHKLKTRLEMIESKQPVVFELPDSNNIPAVLNYLNLREDCSKDDIRKIIGLRLMELSSESPISEDILTNSSITNEQKEELIMFYNAASASLKKWKKK